ncbi:hypothetical protein EBU24_02955 [bacterium]|nr:hypothetical protein [bacterium]
MEKANQVNREAIDNKQRYLLWLIQRMLYKYGESKDLVEPLYGILECLKPKPYILDIPDTDLDRVIAKYYIDFNLESSDDFRIGFSEDQRKELRQCVKALIVDVVNKNIPKDNLIKG